MSSKIYAIMSGGDWADASVVHVIVPEGINVEEERKKCKEYYRNVFCKSKTPPSYNANVPYYSLDEWLVEFCGAKLATENEIKEIWED